MSPPTIAVVGCGAIARAFHLPALARHADVRDRLVLVDPALERCEALGAEFEIEGFATDHRDVVDQVDAAIVAVPPALHADIASDFLRRGRHVLCEKPLASTAEEAREMISAARAGGSTLAVNQNRRLLPALRKARGLISEGTLGSLESIEIYDGAPFDWPLASGAMFGRSSGGRGVLHDIGVHVLDTVCWWLGGAPAISRYVDDSLGGSEAVARVEFEWQGCSGTIQLSWLSKLSNAFQICGEDACLSGGISAWDHVTLQERGGRSRRMRLDRDIPNSLAIRDHVIDNFLDVIREGASPLVSADDVMPSIDLIEKCYDRRETFDMPWLQPPMVHHAGV